MCMCSEGDEILERGRHCSAQVELTKARQRGVQSTAAQCWGAGLTTVYTGKHAAWPEHNAQIPRGCTPSTKTITWRQHPGRQKPNLTEGKQTHTTHRYNFAIL